MSLDNIFIEMYVIVIFININICRLFPCISDYRRFAFLFISLCRIDTVISTDDGHLVARNM